MRFDPTAPVDPRLIDKAAAFMKTLPDATDAFERGYFHWAVSTYSETFPEYNGMVWFDGGEWHMRLTHDPLDNARGSFNNDNYAGHTYRRNFAAFGVSIAGMLRATHENFGPYPLTEAGLDHLCAMAAAFCRKYGVQANVAADGMFYHEAVEHTMMTHAEAARWTPSVSNGVQYPHYYTFAPGGDPDSRWDLNTFQAQTSRPTEAEAYTHGSLLRLRTHVIGARL